MYPPHLAGVFFWFVYNYHRSSSHVLEVTQNSRELAVSLNFAFARCWAWRLFPGFHHSRRSHPLPWACATIIWGSGSRVVSRSAALEPPGPQTLRPQPGSSGCGRLPLRPRFGSCRARAGRTSRPLVVVLRSLTRMPRASQPPPCVLSAGRCPSL